VPAGGTLSHPRADDRLVLASLEVAAGVVADDELEFASYSADDASGAFDVPEGGEYAIPEDPVYEEEEDDDEKMEEDVILSSVIYVNSNDIKLLHEMLARQSAHA
jgi:hypothetical protein